MEDDFAMERGFGLDDRMDVFSKPTRRVDKSGGANASA